MPRKRKRQRLNWGPILVILLLGNIAAGLVFSKLTCVVRVQVHGAKPWDENRIVAALRPLHNVPALMVDPRPLETVVQAQPEVDHADLARNILGHASLTVVYRTPVARVSGPQSMGLSAEGVVFGARDLPTNLPIVTPPKEAAEPVIGFLGNWQAGEVANLCTQVNDLALNRTVVVSVDDQGGVCLNMGTGGQVRLGQPTDLDRKLSILRRKLREDPAFLEPLEYLDLKAPDRPQQKLKLQARQP